MLYINCYNRPRFFAATGIKLQKKQTIFDNLRTIAQESHMQTGQVTPSFSYTFLLQTVCEIIFCILK